LTLREGTTLRPRFSQRLADTVFTRTVQVQWSKRDRYGRIVGKVIADGKDICLLQIESGLAWHYEQYEKEQPAAFRSRRPGRCL